MYPHKLWFSESAMRLIFAQALRSLKVFGPTLKMYYVEKHWFYPHKLGDAQPIDTSTFYLAIYICIEQGELYVKITIMIFKGKDVNFNFIGN